MAKSMTKIKKIDAQEILDSSGNPTLKVGVELEDGTKGWAAVPSGASTGAFEAYELRDEDRQRYGGMGVLKAVKNVKEEIAQALKGFDVLNQKKIDEVMINLDGNERKAKLGANAILGVSLAVCRAAALAKEMPLYAYIAHLVGKNKMKLKIPIPMFNVLNGGKHSDSGLSIQEFLIIPLGISKFSEQLRVGSEIFHTLKKSLRKNNFSISVGDEGGFAPRMSSHALALDAIINAIKESGYIPGLEVSLGLDAAANSFFQPDEIQYHLRPEGVMLSREMLINLYREFIQDKFVISIEDGLNEEDWEGWGIMMKKISQKELIKVASRSVAKENMIVGDDLLVTNVNKLKKAIAENSVNAAIVKPNQIGTLTETLEFIKYAQNNQIKTIVSHRSGETTDDFISDLAVGTDADYIKTGSLSRGERICKYNRLLEIEREL